MLRRTRIADFASAQCNHFWQSRVPDLRKGRFGVCYCQISKLLRCSNFSLCAAELLGYDQACDEVWFMCNGQEFTAKIPPKARALNGQTNTPRQPARQQARKGRMKSAQIGMSALASIFARRRSPDLDHRMVRPNARQRLVGAVLFVQSRADDFPCAIFSQYRQVGAKQVALSSSRED